MLSWVEIYIVAAVVSIAVMSLLTMVMLRNLIGRYERIRREAAELLANFSENLSDINARLTAAGYPPGRIEPAVPATFPRWTPKRSEPR